MKVKTKTKRAKSKGISNMYVKAGPTRNDRTRKLACGGHLKK